jgi:glucose/arabinose dehydrogenase
VKHRTSREPSHRPSGWRLTASLLSVGLLVGACTSGVGADRPTPTEPSPSATSTTPEPSPTETASLGDANVGLEQMAVLDQPIALAVRADDPVLYVAEKVGRVVALVDGLEPDVVLDISDQVSLGSEQGLLGLAFSPEGGFLYVDLTDVNGDTRVLEFAVGDDGIDPASEREVLRVDQPYSNHNGGNLAFGPDGYLYVALGDGGSAGDPEGNAQSLSTLLGKLLRIAPRPSDGEPYAIPPDNPFVGRDGARPEIWAYGLRNPWRFSFDRATGDLWIGDVGQDSWEEIDVEQAGSAGGLNFGWDAREGTHPFESGSTDPEMVLPVFEYPHDGSVCAVTGGYVYRGAEIPALQDAYVFVDFCSGRLEAFVLRDGIAREHRELGPTVESLASFGEDADGELYALSLSGAVYRLVAKG